LSECALYFIIKMRADICMKAHHVILEVEGLFVRMRTKCYYLKLLSAWVAGKVTVNFHFIFINSKVSCILFWVCLGTALQAGSFVSSTPHGVIGIFLWHNPGSHIIFMGSTQPLIQTSAMNISWGVKAAGAQGRQPYHLHVSTISKSGFLHLLETSGPVIGLYRDCFTIYG